MNTLFFKRAFGCIKFFEKVWFNSGQKSIAFLLMDLKNFKKVLLQAIWMFVGDFWSSYNKHHHSKKYLKEWKCWKIKRYYTSRKIERFMYRLAFPQNDLNFFMYYRLRLVHSPLCRKCGMTLETVDPWCAEFFFF